MTALEAIALVREVLEWLDTSRVRGVTVAAYPARRVDPNTDSHWLIEFRIGAHSWQCSSRDHVNEWLTRLATNTFDALLQLNAPPLLSSLARKAE